jgi:hypothetical protein
MESIECFQDACIHLRLALHVEVINLAVCIPPDGDVEQLADVNPVAVERALAGVEFAAPAGRIVFQGNPVISLNVQGFLRSLLMIRL